MRLLAALCVLAAARAEETSQKSRLLVVNGLDNDAQIDVYFAGSRGEGLWSAGPPPSVKPGTMVCVASSVQAGFEFEVHVGEIDDEFVVTLSSNNARQGETYGQTDGLIRWRHTRNEDATIYLTNDGDAHAVWRDDLDEISQLAWKDGVGALFEDADRFLVRGDRKNARRAFATARRSLGLAVATDGAAPLVWPLAVLAGVAPANDSHIPSIEDVQPLSEGSQYVDTIRRRALHHGCWLARLTLGSWRAHGKRGMEEDCGRACDVWTLLLRDVAPFGGGSPRRALVKTRHVNLRQAELLVDHWLRADGMATLRDDAMQQFDEVEDEEDVVAPEIIDTPAPAAPGGFFRRLLHGPDDLYDEVVFDGAPMEDGGRVIDDAGAAYLERRAVNGDGHAALQLGDAWLDGRVARRRPSAAAAARFYAEGLKSKDAHASADSAAALAELWLGGHDGVPARLAKALEILETSASTPLGDHLLGHLYDVIDMPPRLPNRSLAIKMWERAVEQHHADSFVSLARALRDTDQTRASSLLSDALREGDSLTAALLLSQMHLRGLLDGDWELHTTNLEEMRCSRAREVLEEGIQQAWDASLPGFGVGDAVAAGRAAWERSGLFSSTSVEEEDFYTDEVHGDALLDALRKRVDARNERRLKDHTSGLNAPARARGAYRMLATLGEAGLGAAHVNAGFVLERLGRGNPDLLKRAKWHYEQTLSGRETNSSEIARAARKLEFAEARRALASCRRDGWAGACDQTCAQDDSLFEAAKRGSEWAALEASLDAYRAGSYRRATVLASDCSYRFVWPHRVPCALIAALLSARAMVFDLSWYVTWARRDRALHTEGDVDALLAEFG